MRNEENENNTTDKMPRPKIYLGTALITSGAAFIIAGVTIVGQNMCNIPQLIPWWIILLLVFGGVMSLTGLLAFIPPRYLKGILYLLNPITYWREYQEDKYWKAHGVKYELTSIGTLLIELDNVIDKRHQDLGYTQRYNFTLPIKITFRNRDKEYPATIRCGDLQFSIKTQDTTFRKSDYYIWIVPSENNNSSGRETYFHLSANAISVSKEYLLKGFSWERPYIGEIAHIKTTNPGIIQLLYHDDREVKFKPLKVNVDWSKVRYIPKGDSMSQNNNQAPLTKKRFERLLRKAAQPLPQKECAQEETQTSASHQHDDYSDRCKSQDKTEGKEG